MIIKVLEKTEGCMPEILENGDWIDLRLAEDVRLNCPKACKLHRRKDKEKEGNMEERIRDVLFDSALVRLGVAIALPKGMEAYILPRSSTFKKYGLLQTNSKAVIDYSFRGNEDEWRLPVIATRAVTIPKGTRIAQFRIALSQKAGTWQKLRWLLSSGIELVKVDSLGSENRGGFGSTGK